ncbi:MAG: hypothetical protein AAF125_04735 [Chloroflexota bacterium]
MQERIRKQTEVIGGFTVHAGENTLALVVDSRHEAAYAFVAVSLVISLLNVMLFVIAPIVALVMLGVTTPVVFFTAAAMRNRKVITFTRDTVEITFEPVSLKAPQRFALSEITGIDVRRTGNEDAHDTPFQIDLTRRQDHAIMLLSDIEKEDDARVIAARVTAHINR